MAARQAAEFATPTPSRWNDLAAQATTDFFAYMLFVKQLYPTEHLQVMAERLVFGGPQEMILGPPGCGKSTAAVCFLEWTLGRDNNYRWMICSEIEGRVPQEHLSAIASTIEYNENYHKVFGRLKGRPWAKDRLNLVVHTPHTAPPPWPWLTPRGRRPDLRWPNVMAVSWHSGIQGIRTDGILLDDYVSEATSRSEVGTGHAFEALVGKVLPRRQGSPYSRGVLMLGQRWRPHDIYGLMMDPPGGRVKTSWLAYDNNPANRGLHVLEQD